MSEKQLHFFNSEDNKSFKKRYTITLPLDTFILLFIVILLLLALSFSLGVERGRKVVPFNIDTAKKDLLDIKDKTISPNIETEQSSIENQAITEDNTTQIKEKEITEITQNKKEENVEKKIPKERYIIQIASYVDQERAEAELKKLQKKGYPGFISKKGKFVVVSIGEFNNKAEAQKKLKLLKELYSDCFLKSLN